MKRIFISISLLFGLSSWFSAHATTTFLREKPPISQALLHASQVLTKNLTPNIRQTQQQNREYDFRYIELGGGAAIWQTSHETNMENQRNVLHFFGEYGDLQKAWAIGGSYNMRSSYIQQGFVLEPSYISAHVKYIPTRLIYGWPVWFNLYALGGPTYWQASLTNTNFGNVGNQEALTENDSGVGFMLGTGASVDILNFSLSVQWSYFYGKGQFEAGSLAPQDVYAGSAQVLVLLSYRFFLNGSLWKCPTYK